MNFDKKDIEEAFTEILRAAKKDYVNIVLPKEKKLRTKTILTIEKLPSCSILPKRGRKHIPELQGTLLSKGLCVNTWFAQNFGVKTTLEVKLSNGELAHQSERVFHRRDFDVDFIYRACQMIDSEREKVEEEIRREKMKRDAEDAAMTKRRQEDENKKRKQRWDDFKAGSILGGVAGTAGAVAAYKWGGEQRKKL